MDISKVNTQPHPNPRPMALKIHIGLGIKSFIMTESHYHGFQTSSPRS